MGRGAWRTPAPAITNGDIRDNHANLGILASKFGHPDSPHPTQARVEESITLSGINGDHQTASEVRFTFVMLVAGLPLPLAHSCLGNSVAACRRDIKLSDPATAEGTVHSMLSLQHVCALYFVTGPSPEIFPRPRFSVAISKVTIENLCILLHPNTSFSPNGI